MNRTGLYIALMVALVCGLAFGLIPALDLKISALFYDAAAKTFPLKFSARAELARNAAMWIAWAFVIPSIAAILVKLFRPTRPMLMSARAAVFLISTMLLSSVLLSNIVFKTYWGRPRPIVVTEFNGPLDFVPWWDPRGKCEKNCSFFSGEGSAAFWTYAPAALAPPAWRPLAYVAATAFGMATGGLRMTFGGHFATDVIFSGVVSFLVVWLVYALLYRWPSTRLSDEDIDAWLTRLAWPGYRWRQKLWGRDVGPSPRIRPGAATTP